MSWFEILASENSWSQHFYWINLIESCKHYVSRASHAPHWAQNSTAFTWPPAKHKNSCLPQIQKMGQKIYNSTECEFNKMTEAMTIKNKKGFFKKWLALASFFFNWMSCDTIIEVITTGYWFTRRLLLFEPAGVNPVWPRVKTSHCPVVSCVWESVRVFISGHVRCLNKWRGENKTQPQKNQSTWVQHKE